MLTMVNTMLIRLDYECEQNQCPTMIKSNNNNTSTMAKSSVIVMDNNDNSNDANNQRQNVWKRLSAPFSKHHHHPPSITMAACHDFNDDGDDGMKQQPFKRIRMLRQHQHGGSLMGTYGRTGSFVNYNRPEYYCWRHDQQFRRYQMIVNNFFELPNGKLSISYHIMV